MKKGKIIILSGPSGSGKTTLYEKLLISPKIRGKLIKTISVTTRPKRPGERHGRDYFFISPKMFLYKKRAGHFLETQKVFDNYYGTPKKAVYDLMNAGKNVLLCIDVFGSKIVKRKVSSAIRIFVKTQNLTVLEKRLKQRGSEDKESFQLRLNTAKKELLEAKHYDYTVINDNLSKTCQKLEDLVLKIV